MCLWMYGEEGAQILGAQILVAHLRKAVADCAIPLAGPISLTSSSKCKGASSSTKLIDLI